MLVKIQNNTFFSRARWETGLQIRSKSWSWNQRSLDIPMGSSKDRNEPEPILAVRALLFFQLFLQHCPLLYSLRLATSHLWYFVVHASILCGFWNFFGTCKLARAQVRSHFGWRSEPRFFDASTLHTSGLDVDLDLFQNCADEKTTFNPQYFMRCWQGQTLLLICADYGDNVRWPIQYDRLGALKMTDHYAT